MNRLWMVLAFSLLSLSVASASSIPCSVSTGLDVSVTSATVVTCGGLTFDNFEVVNATNGAPGLAGLSITGVSFDTDLCPGEVCISFDPAMGSITAVQDEDLLFQVWGGTYQIDMSVGGQGAIITELACSAAVPDSGAQLGVCPEGDLLGEITVASQEAASVCPGNTCAPFNPTSPVYIFKNIDVGAGGALSEFTQTFGVPEPVSMVLLGSGLLGLGLLRRRSRKS